MIRAIEVGTISDSYQNKYNDKMLYLNNLKKVNIFVGENNSGKSRLLRNIINGKEVKVFSEIENPDNKNSFDLSKRNMLNNINEYNSYGVNKILFPNYFNDLDDSNYYCEVSDFFQHMNYDTSNMNQNQKSYYSNAKGNLKNMYEFLSRKENTLSSKTINDYSVTYIPILRGIECFDNYYQLNKNDVFDSIMINENQRKSLEEYKSNAKHIYENKISEVYSMDLRKIFTAENLFDEITKKLLGEEKERNFIRDFENFISKEFYDNEGFTIIPQIDKGYINVKIGSCPDRALHHLGDGIKQLITIFYKLFEKRNEEALFFIEEPEINLHPGYQRQFMKIIQENDLFSKHQFFITTHSNHLIDNCLNYDNISIYKFVNIEKSNNKFQVLNTNNGDIDILNLLGVYNSSVFLANCTIWVEGISDKILISKYMEVYLKSMNDISYKEDINYSFVEYDGNNIDHWCFSDSKEPSTINASGITNRSFIICDNDDDGKQERKQKLKKVFGRKNYYELKVREIENTISRAILEKSLFGNDKPEFLNEYNGTPYASKSIYMGDFIDKHYKLSKKYSNRVIKTGKGSGTIKEKLSFSKNVSSNINNINDLSPSALDLCKKIFDFIKRSNI